MGSNRGFSGGSSAKYPLCYQLWLRNQLDSLFIAITTVQDCSPIFPQGGQGKRVWLTVREPSMKAGWWDAPLALRDSVVSNVLDYPRHELLIAKLHAYGISFWHKATIKKSVGHMVNDTTCSIGFNSRAIIIQSFSLQLILLSERHRYSYNYSQNIWD